MPEKRKHFHVFMCETAKLEDELNRLFHEGFSVVQVLPYGAQDRQIVTIRMPQLDMSAVNTPSSIPK